MMLSLNTTQRALFKQFDQLTLLRLLPTPCECAG